MEERSCTHIKMYEYKILSDASPLIIRASLVAQSEKAMAPDSGTLAWQIPWTEEPGGLQSMGSLRVGHD